MTVIEVTKHLSHPSPGDRDVLMHTTETAPPTYRSHGTAEGLPPAGSARYRYRWATFGGRKVMVAGELLERLEQLTEQAP